MTMALGWSFTHTHTTHRQTHSTMHSLQTGIDDDGPGVVVLVQLDEDVPVRLLVLDVSGLGAEVQAVDGGVGVAGEEQLLVLGVVGQAFCRTHVWGKHKGN